MRPAMHSSLCREIEGNWHVIIGRLKQKCGEFHDNDLRIEEGKEEELLGQLEKRTGMTSEQIRRFIESLHQRSNDGNCPMIPDAEGGLCVPSGPSAKGRD
jgi:uncharacterized protein YjbJ (UPF0337 family)